MFKWLKETKPNKEVEKYVTQNSLGTILSSLSDSLGEFAPIETKYDKQKERMSLVINRIRDEVNQNNNFELFYLFAISIRNFTSWYIRGDERKKYLDEVIFYLEKSIGLNDKFVEAKAELGLLLIEQKVVRNLEKGYSILNGLKNINQLPSYLDSTLSKAERQLGLVCVEDNFDFSNLNPAPAVFAEERKKYRTLIRKYKKEKDIDNLKRTLKNFYNLAILVVVCYGSHDCKSGVVGHDYDLAIGRVKKIGKKINFSFKENGYIKNCNFISNNDWKQFISVFGEIDKEIDPTNNTF